MDPHGVDWDSSRIASLERARGSFYRGDGVGRQVIAMSSIRVTTSSRPLIRTDFKAWWRLILIGGGDSTSKESLVGEANKPTNLGVGPAGPSCQRLELIFGGKSG
jgi:hypothetical protein